MKTWLKEQFDRLPKFEGDRYGEFPSPLNGGLPHEFHDLGRWDELAAEVAQEGQGRVAIVGPPQSGKRLLLNRLRGWDLTAMERSAPRETPDGMAVESYGSFVLADLTQPRDGTPVSGDELLLALGDPALALYVVNAARGVQPADYRWVALLRAGGRPVLVALNGVEACDDPPAAATQAARRLGATVIPISADTGFNVEEQLLPALLNAVPRLAVPLGREIQGIRQMAARRVIRQAALFAGILGAQPVPLLDLPFQVMLQSGMVMRVGASFGYAPGGGLNREILATVAGALALRNLAQTLVKFVPVLGWVVGGALAAASTLLIGEAAIGYYAAGGTIPLRQWIREARPVRRARRAANVEAAPAEEAQP